jgi:putative NADH-flavin reductase
MKRILVLGATGHLGKVLLDCLIKNNYHIVVLVRNPQKLIKKYSELTVIKGDPTSYDNIDNALNNIDIVISTLSHGFRTSYPIQEKTMTVLLPLMEKKHITRFISVTGSGLNVKGDPKSLIGKYSEIFLSLIDPYRMSDAKNMQYLLEKSTIDWTVIRTPIHNNRLSQKMIHVGFKQPKPWHTLSRNTITEFIVACIKKNNYIREAPIIY